MGRAWVPLLLVLFLLNHAIAANRNAALQVDHVTICGSDLDAMRQVFARFGLDAQYGGPHANSGTHMALLGFGDGSYVELLAPEDPNQPLPPRAPWPKEMQGNAGPCGWTINVRQIKAAVESFRRRGLPASTPSPGGRLRPDRVPLEWETAALAGGADRRLPFLIQDHTPHGLRAPVSASLARTELNGVAVVVLAVRDLKASVALFQRAFDWSAPVIRTDRQLNARVAQFSGTPVVLAAPLSGDSWLAERLRRFGEMPAALLIGTRDFDASRTRFHLDFTGTIGGHRLAWFDPARLAGIRLGIVEVTSTP